MSDYSFILFLNIIEFLLKPLHKDSLDLSVDLGCFFDMFHDNILQLYIYSYWFLSKSFFGAFLFRIFIELCLASHLTRHLRCRRSPKLMTTPFGVVDRSHFCPGPRNMLLFILGEQICQYLRLVSRRVLSDLEFGNVELTDRDFSFYDWLSLDLQRFHGLFTPQWACWGPASFVGWEGHAGSTAFHTVRQLYAYWSFASYFHIIIIHI